DRSPVTSTGRRSPTSATASPTSGTASRTSGRGSRTSGSMTRIAATAQPTCVTGPQTCASVPRTSASSAATPNARPSGGGAGGLEEELRDLDRVQRGALDEVVAREEEHEAAVLARPVGADPPDEHILGLGGRARARRLDDPYARRGGEQRLRQLRRERPVRLDPDRLRMADEHRHAHRRRADRQLRQLEDLARLGADLRLLVGLVALPVPVEPEVVLVGRLGAELLHPLRARAGDRLVRREADAAQARRVVERLEDARERDRRAVRVRDDAGRLEGGQRALAVHLRHDERIAVGEPVGARLVDDERATLDGVGDELAGRGRAAGEEHEVEVARGERAGRRLLDDDAGAQLATCRPRGCKGPHVLVAALAEEPQRHRPDGARRADDADPRVRAHAVPSSNASCSAATAFGTSPLATWQAILIGEVEITSAVTPASSRVANVFAAMPGWLFMPAPTRLTFPRSSRIDHSTS